MLVRIDSQWVSASSLPPAALPVVPGDFGSDFESPPQPAAASKNAAASSHSDRLLEARRRSGVAWPTSPEARRTAREACLLQRKSIVIGFYWRTRNRRPQWVRARFAGGAVVG